MQPEPTIKVIDLACTCFCVRCDPCCLGKKVVIVPFKYFPPPCCCFKNEVGPCDNCFSLCVPMLGNPKQFEYFTPQPKDPEAFVKAANEALDNALERKGTSRLSGMPPMGDEMER